VRLARFVIASLFLGGTALAQDVEVSVGDGASDPAETPGFVEGGGVKLTDGLYFHPKFELATGYQSNVFYQDSSEGIDGPAGSMLMRLSAGAAINRSNGLPLDAAETRKIDLNADLNLTWHQYLSGNDYVMGQSDLGIGLLAKVQFNITENFNLWIREGFTRAIQPTSSQSTADLNRDKNEIQVGMMWSPGGGAIQGYFHYMFTIDLFERSELDFANRLWHQFTLGAKWQWLPKTQFLLETSLGIYEPNSEILKSSSTPLRITAGVATLITERFGVVLKAGYGNGFYNSGSSFSSYLATVELRYAIGPMLRTAVGYAHEFADSLIANYYTDHAFYARLSTVIASRLNVMARGEVRLRTYEGLRDPPMFDFCGDATCTGTTRSDVLARLDLTADYPLKQWLSVGGAFSLLNDSTDFFVRDPATGTTDVGAFTWAELMVRVVAQF
jgi:hypothetical protein